MCKKPHCCENDKMSGKPTLSFHPHQEADRSDGDTHIPTCNNNHDQLVEEYKQNALESYRSEQTVLIDQVRPYHLSFGI